MQQERESAELCTNGCGFFGATGTGGMCSLCWKKTMSNRQVETKPKLPSTAETQETNKDNNATIAEPVTVPTTKEKEQTATTTTTVTDAATTVTGTLPVSTDVATGEENAEKKIEEEKPVQKNRKRCWECKKKVGLTAIECRCGFVFCGSHRYADQHACTFDYKAADRAELARRNPGGGQFGKLEKL
jgi:predicted nucleic acid binding AN1-type Zn finger protein